ncbi:MAG: helix-turn-helix domain-containing protein [Lachnospiraceae bacterium]|nr:helix-turn-helix domain-containing protein [Lachnospiraceae bacterium]
MKYFRRIRDLREDKDLTQTDMGKLLNVSQRAYAHYENGTRNLPVELLIEIADYHKVSVDYILERTNVKEMNIGK